MSDNYSASVDAQIKNEYRARQLMQVWRDYYDEILEVNYETGTYVSLMSADEAEAKKGFLELDLLLLLKSKIFPDDVEAFKSFVDKNRLMTERKAGKRVTKLNFRYKVGYDSYVWVKGKNIIPEYQGKDEFICFMCFRIVDAEKSEELVEHQRLVDELRSTTEVSNAREELLEELSHEFRSHLQGIIGMSSIAKMAIRDTGKTLGRLEKIEEEAKSMAAKLDTIIDKERNGFLDGMEEAALDSGVLYHAGFAGVKKDKFEDSNGESFEEWKRKRDAVDSADDVDEVDYNTVDEDEEFDFSGRRVLVVEDNPLNCETMIEILEMAGFKTEAAVDGKSAAIDFIKNPVGYYDIILMDIELPVIDGIEATKCIRISGKDDASTVPIFAVSALSRLEDPRISRDSGFNESIAKPVDFRLLYRKMKKAIDSKVEYVKSGDESD